MTAGPAKPTASRALVVFASLKKDYQCRLGNERIPDKTIASQINLC